MKLILAGIVLILTVETNAQWYNFPVEAAQGNTEPKFLFLGTMYFRFDFSQHY